MASINDWAAKAAREINAQGRASDDRIAAIITLHAKPLLDLLRPREHHHEDDDNWCCGKCPHCEEDHEHDLECFPQSHGYGRKRGVCNCGVDDFNARLVRALAGDD